MPAFRFLFLNNIGFFIASNAQRFVFGWFVLDGLDGTEGDQGLAVFALGLPGVFLLLHAGVWADRWNRKRLMIGSQVASAAAMGAAMVVVDSEGVTLTWVVLLALIAGSATAVGQPVRQSLVPALVSREQLFNAIALNAIAGTFSLIIGSAAAKLFGDLFGFPGAFGFLFVLFIIGLGALAPLRVPPHHDLPAKRAIRVEAIEAARYVWHARALRKLFGLLAVAGLIVSPLFQVTLQAHVKGELGRSSGDAALPFAVMGIGIAAASVIVMRKGNMKNKGAAFMRAMICGTTLVALMGRTTQLWQLTILAGLMGFAAGFFVNMNQGLIQANTPQELMGRVMSLYTLIQVSIGPIGALGLGFLAAEIGTGNTMTLISPIATAYVVITYVTDKELRHMS